MDLDKAIEIMKVEQECVRRQDTSLCNRDECGCQCCDLIQESADVLEAYDIAIECMSKFRSDPIENILNIYELMKDELLKEVGESNE